MEVERSQAPGFEGSQLRRSPMDQFAVHIEASERALWEPHQRRVSFYANRLIRLCVFFEGRLTTTFNTAFSFPKLSFPIFAIRRIERRYSCVAEMRSTEEAHYRNHSFGLRLIIDFRASCHFYASTCPKYTAGYHLIVNSE